VKEKGKKEYGAMIKKMSLLTAIIILIALIPGCGGGSSSGGGGDQTVTNSGILTLFSNYETAIEAYDVDKMLKCLDDSGNFTLTINEGSYSQTKDYVTLKTELESDKDCQIAWRKATDNPDGHNYKLDLKLGTPISNNETSSGAVVKQTFEVWESSDEVPNMKTDSGNIVWTLVQSSGEWKAMAMTINYSTSKSAASVKAGLATTGYKGKGFGYSKMGF
jgi:hypothetical protein